MIHRYKDHAPQIDPSCFIAPGSAVIGKVIIGKNSSVWHNAVIRGDMAQIVIGENSNIQDGSVLHCVPGKVTTVGNNVVVGHGVILHSCSIGDNSLVGMGSIVLDGVKVGNNCLIGAGAIVTPNTEIPDGSLVLGSPAKVKRALTEGEIAKIQKGVVEYMSLAEDYKATKEE